jgi:hypothetical protein
MCKINILCKQLDGQCNCHKQNIRALENTRPHSGLLCSILSYIKDQPEILKSLSETSQVSIDNILSKFSSIDNEFENTSPTQASLQDGATDLQVNIINDLPNRIIVGKTFPLMAEITDKYLVKADILCSETFQVVLVGKKDGLDKLVLGEVKTDGVALFRKVRIDEEVGECNLVVRIKGKSEITQYCQEIEVRARRTDEKIVKKFKAEEILA